MSEIIKVVAEILADALAASAKNCTFGSALQVEHFQSNGDDIPILWDDTSLF